MVDIERIAAMACSCDTLMARAFRRALGIDAPAREARRRSRREVRQRKRAAYSGMRECFENRVRARTDV